MDKPTEFIRQDLKIAFALLTVYGLCMGGLWIWFAL